jgi:hypothetical protein
MNITKIKRSILTLLITILGGTFLAILPVSLIISVIDLRRFDIAHQSLMDAIWIWMKVFGATTLGAYYFGLMLGFPSTLAAAVCFSTIGWFKNQMPINSAMLAFATSISLGAFFEWHFLVCQCHPNLAGAVYLKPVVFLTTYFLLTFGSWFMIRPVWRKVLSK